MNNGNLNISNAHVSDMENGKAKPSIDLLLRIAKYFNCSTDYLLGLSDDPLGIDDELEPKVIRESEAVYVAAGATERQIMELLPALSDADKFLILQTVERLTNTPTPHIIGNDE